MRKGARTDFLLSRNYMVAHIIEEGLDALGMQWIEVKGDGRTG